MNMYFKKQRELLGRQTDYKKETICQVKLEFLKKKTQQIIQNTTYGTKHVFKDIMRDIFPV